MYLKRPCWHLYYFLTSSRSTMATKGQHVSFATPFWFQISTAPFLSVPLMRWNIKKQCWFFMNRIQSAFLKSYSSSSLGLRLKPIFSQRWTIIVRSTMYHVPSTSGRQAKYQDTFWVEFIYILGTIYLRQAGEVPKYFLSRIDILRIRTSYLVLGT